MYKLCNQTGNLNSDWKEASSQQEGQDFDNKTKACLSRWAESLGSRATLGKLLMEWMQRKGISEKELSP